MAVVATLSKGYDLEYIWKQVDRGPAKDAASYYIQARRELRVEATRQTRQSPLFYDLTLSLSKSISIFHASLGENARQAGDAEGDRYWSGLVSEVDEMIWQAAHAGFGYFQHEAGYTRTGSHNTRPEDYNLAPTMAPQAERQIDERFDDAPDLQ